MYHRSSTSRKKRQREQNNPRKESEKGKKKEREKTKERSSLPAPNNDSLIYRYGERAGTKKNRDREGERAHMRVRKRGSPVCQVSCVREYVWVSVWVSVNGGGWGCMCVKHDANQMLWYTEKNTTTRNQNRSDSNVSRCTATAIATYAVGITRAKATGTIICDILLVYTFTQIHTYTCKNV